MLTGFKALDQNIPSAVIRSEKEFIKQREHAEYVLRQLKESERILDTLRPIPAVPRTLDQATIQEFMKITADLRPADYSDDPQDALVVDPSAYFATRYAEQIKKYGPAFFGTDAVWDGRQIFVPEALNDLTLASVLGAPCLGCQVVYFASEDQWYCSDYRIDGAFFPTSEEKLGILASHFLIQCTQRCHHLTAKAVLKVRTPQTIKAILTTARTMLEADGQFFQGKHGHRRYIQNKYVEPNEEPLYRIFVKKGIVQQAGAKLVEHECFHRFYEFCRSQGAPALTRADFRSLVAEVIREEFNLGLRHDVLGDDGHQHKGWIGITYRQPDATLMAGRN